MRTMTTQPAKSTVPMKPDLTAQYRPLGLKAVLAAALMIKAPKKKLA